MTLLSTARRPLLALALGSVTVALASAEPPATNLRGASSPATAAGASVDDDEVVDPLDEDPSVDLEHAEALADAGWGWGWHHPHHHYHHYHPGWGYGHHHHHWHHWFALPALEELEELNATNLNEYWSAVFRDEALSKAFVSGLQELSSQREDSSRSTNVTADGVQNKSISTAASGWGWGHHHHHHGWGWGHHHHHHHHGWGHHHHHHWFSLASSTDKDTAAVQFWESVFMDGEVTSSLGTWLQNKTKGEMEAWELSVANGTVVTERNSIATFGDLAMSAVEQNLKLADAADEAAEVEAEVEAEAEEVEAEIPEAESMAAAGWWGHHHGWGHHHHHGWGHHHHHGWGHHHHWYSLPAADDDEEGNAKAEDLVADIESQAESAAAWGWGHHHHHHGHGWGGWGHHHHHHHGHHGWGHHWYSLPEVQEQELQSEPGPGLEVAATAEKAAEAANDESLATAASASGWGWGHHHPHHGWGGWGHHHHHHHHHGWGHHWYSLPEDQESKLEAAAEQAGQESLATAASNWGWGHHHHHHHGWGGWGHHHHHHHGWGHHWYSLPEDKDTAVPSSTSADGE